MSNPDHAKTVENLTGTSKQTSEALSNAKRGLHCINVKRPSYWK